jgi:hypothetical protein
MQFLVDLGALTTADSIWQIIENSGELGSRLPPGAHVCDSLRRDDGFSLDPFPCNPTLAGQRLFFSVRIDSDFRARVDIGSTRGQGPHLAFHVGKCQCCGRRFWWPSTGKDTPPMIYMPILSGDYSHCRGC